MLGALAFLGRFFFPGRSEILILLFGVKGTLQYVAHFFAVEVLIVKF